MDPIGVPYFHIDFGLDAMGRPISSASAMAPLPRS